MTDDQYPQISGFNPGSLDRSTQLVDELEGLSPDVIGQSRVDDALDAGSLR